MHSTFFSGFAEDKTRNKSLKSIFCKKIKSETFHQYHEIYRDSIKIVAFQQLFLYHPFLQKPKPKTPLLNLEIPSQEEISQMLHFSRFQKSDIE